MGDYDVTGLICLTYIKELEADLSISCDITNGT